jgi:hypothetical protein
MRKSKLIVLRSYCAGLFQRWHQWKGDGDKRRVNEVNMVDIFLFIYKNKRMKSVKIVLRRRVKGKRENNGGGKSKIHSKHICKYHNVFPCTTITC